MEATGATIAVVITTFNDARFLPEAVASVLAQTEPCSEIIVVDDGSERDPAPVLASFRGITLIRRSNGGPSAARNTGWRASRCDAFVFLDADDRLLPGAIAAGTAALARAPEAAFVYGGHRRVDAAGRPIGADVRHPIGPHPYRRLLAGNLIGMNASVIFRREPLAEAGGFDERLRRCEDYDLYLRIAARHPVASHNEVVAEYRWHDANASTNLRAMLSGSLAVLDQHRPEKDHPEDRRAWLAGQREFRRYYAAEILRQSFDRWRRDRRAAALLRDYVSVLGVSPWVALTQAPARLARRALRRRS